MKYESWRISYQSSEAAARSAWQEMIRLHHRVNELEAQLSAIGAGGVEPLRKQAVPAAVAEQEENQGQYLFDAVLNCPHSITHESITLHFYPKQKAGHNALAQLRHRLAAADAARPARPLAQAPQRESYLGEAVQSRGRGQRRDF